MFVCKYYLIYVIIKYFAQFIQMDHLHDRTVTILHYDILYRTDAWSVIFS